MRTRNRRNRKRNTRKQKRNTRKQKGGVVAAYEHANPDPGAMIAPYKGMRWTYGPYTNQAGHNKVGWYISTTEAQNAEYAQEQIDDQNALYTPNEMDNFMARFS
jgi:hypothetical protein